MPARNLPHSRPGRGMWRPRRSLTGWIAGINHGAHDGSCVLTHEGRTVVWVETDRISRIKHGDGRSPAEALHACLKFAGLQLHDLDCIALGSNHARLIKWLGDDPERCDEVSGYSGREWLFPPRLFGEQDELPAVETVAHHAAHAASAFFASGLREAAALVMDAMGEDVSTSVARCSEDRIDILHTYGVEDSLGYFYETATQFAGFSRNSAGKLMGLAGYGKPIYDLPLRPPTDDDDRIWQLDEAESESRGRLRTDARCRALTQAFKRIAFPFAAGLVGEPMAYRDFAASAQQTLERVVVALARQAVRRAQSSALVLAGGVALNCAANGKIADSGLCDSLFVQPASTDSGVALGAALLLGFQMYGESCRPTIMTHAYHGLQETDEDVLRELEQSGLTFEHVSPEQLVSATASALCEGQPVAWHQGRAEIGPRALGARSLLGDPRSRATTILLNRIKCREEWRPLAPSVCAEDFADFFEGTPNPFMIVAARMRADAVSRIPAVVHFDRTARPQAVDRQTNPLFYRLLREFGARTGIPVLTNTSLNGKDEPICYRTADTLAFFRATSIPLLAIGSYLVRNPASN
jgi:carbamoyltransferase